MRRKIALALLFGFCAGLAGAFGLNVDPNQTGSIVISNNPAAPTQIFTNDLAAMRTYIVNTSSCNVFVVGFSTTSALSISSAAVVSTNLTTGSFYVAAGTTTIFNNNPNPTVFQTFSPDGPTDPYRGPLWAASGCSWVTTIQRFRAH